MSVSLKARIESDHNTLTHVVRVLGETRGEMHRRFDQIDEKLEQQGKDITELKASNEALKSDVEVLKSDVEVLKSDVGELKSDVGELKSDVAELKAANKEVNAKLDLILAKISS